MSTARHDVRFHALVGLFAFLSVSPIPNPANGNVLSTAKNLAKSLPFLAQNKFSRSRNPFSRLPSQQGSSQLKSVAVNQEYEDVVFIIDDSGSIPRDQFNKGLRALTYFIDASSWGTNFAAIKYSEKATLLFNFVSLNEAKKKLTNVPYSAGGSTNTQEALKMARTDLFLNPAVSGHRQSADRVVVLVTDGNSNVQRDQTVPQANLLKMIGTKIIVIGIGNYGDSGYQELKKIASHPSTKNLFEMKNFNEFDRVANMVAKAPWLQG